MFFVVPHVKAPRSLAFHLTVWYAVAMCAFVLLLFVALYSSVTTLLDRKMNADLREDLAEYSMLYRSEGLLRLQKEMDRETLGAEAQLVFLQLLNRNGEVLYSTDLSAWAGWQADHGALASATADTDETPLYTQSIKRQEHPTRLIYGALDPRTILVVGESLEELYDLNELLLKVFVAMSLLLLPLTCALSWWMARRAVRGVVTVSHAATAIANGRLDERVTVVGDGAEIVQLAQAFNNMANRVCRLMTEMREVNDNIAHDLRSPLARIRALAESALTHESNGAKRSDLAIATLEECDRLLHLINTTLDIAEVEAGVVAGQREPVDVTALVEDGGELFKPVAEEKHIVLSVHAEPNCQMIGHRRDLQRTLANLLDNAIKYTNEYGHIEVGLSKGSEQLELMIKDDGVGIDVVEHDKIFQRFYRCDRSRSQYGSGLGLSLVQAIVRAHWGSIVVNSEPNQGSIFSIHLPLTPPEASNGLSSL